MNNLFVTPFEKLTEMTHRVAETASLHLIARLKIADLLPPPTSLIPVSHQAEEEGEEGGVDIERLSFQADVPHHKLVGPLRLLTTSGWFEEVREGVFRCTKFSEQLRTRMGYGNGNGNGGDGEREESGEWCWVRSS